MKHATCIVGALLGILIATGFVTSANARPSPDTCSSTWTGAVNNRWTVAGNWSPAGVPTAQSAVCVTTVTGPTIGASDNVTVQDLQVTGSTLVVNGFVTTTSLTVTGSVVQGSGTLAGAVDSSYQLPATLDGVELTGSVHLAMLYTIVTVTGGDTACGAAVSLCVSGSAQARFWRMELSGSIIDGDTTARPAVTLGVLDTSGGRSGSSRVAVDLHAGYVQVGQTLTLDSWDALQADGELDGDASVNAGQLNIARSITSLGPSSLAAGKLRTPTGTDALTSVTDIGLRADLVDTLAVPFAPLGGTVTVDGVLNLTAQRGTLQVNGSIVSNGVPDELNLTGTGFHSSAIVTGTLTSKALLTAPALQVGRYLQTGGTAYLGGLSTTNATVRGGTLTFTGDATADLGGTRLVFLGGSLQQDATSCAHVNGSVAMANADAARYQLAHTDTACAARVDVSGTLSVPPSLFLTYIRSDAPQVGDSRILFQAAVGVTGRFKHIHGASVGANHWEISYTATQVVATVVAGPT